MVYDDHYCDNDQNNDDNDQNNNDNDQNKNDDNDHNNNDNDQNKNDDNDQNNNDDDQNNNDDDYQCFEDQELLLGYTQPLKALDYQHTLKITKLPNCDEMANIKDGATMHDGNIGQYWQYWQEHLVKELLEATTGTVGLMRMECDQHIFSYFLFHKVL